MAEDQKTTKKPAKAKATKAKAKVQSAKPSPKAETNAKKAPKAPAQPKAPLAPRTYLPAWGEPVAKWRLIDATGKTLGRLSSYVATALMGKDKPTYTRHVDAGDFVIVINAEKIKMTGDKVNQKKYFRYSGYPGGLKIRTAEELYSKHPERLIENAVYGMLPKGALGQRWFKKLKVYVGSQHPHEAQKPEKVELTRIGGY